VLLIRIRIFIKKDPDPHLSDKLDLDPHQFTDDKPKCMEYDPTWALFKSLSFYLEARIRIRIRKGEKWDPDPHESDKSDPDPHQRDADPQHPQTATSTSSRFRPQDRYLTAIGIKELMWGGDLWI
jgi:hypothetical protein